MSTSLVVQRVCASRMWKRYLHFLTLAFVPLLLVGCGGKKSMTVDEEVREVNGVKLYTKVVGTGNPLLILHGGPGLDHSYLLPQMNTLAERHRLIFYDQRGTGRSGGPVDSSTITLDNFINDVEGIRQTFHLGQVDIMGHSWGAMLAMLYAMRYPQNVHALIITNPGGASTQFLQQGVETQRARLTESNKLYLATLSRTEGFKNRDAAHMQDYFRILFRTTFYHKDRADSLTLSFTNATATNVMLVAQLLFRGMEKFDVHEKLSAITCPTLIIHGEADAVPAEAAQRIHERIRSSRLVVLKNSGHFSYLDSPDEFFKTVSDFLVQASK